MRSIVAGLVVVVGLFAGCEEKFCVGGTGSSGDCVGDPDAGGDGDADGDADPYVGIASAYEAERVAKQVPGVAVAIVEDGELSWSQGFGTRSVDSRDPVTPDTRFRLLTSSFVALAILQLVDQGLMSRDDLLEDK